MEEMTMTTTTLTRTPHISKYAIAAAVNAEVQRRAVQRAPTRAPVQANVTDRIPMSVIVDELRDIAEQIPGDPVNAVKQLNDLIADLTVNNQ
jgi:hypothetical protein